MRFYLLTLLLFPFAWLNAQIDLDKDGIAEVVFVSVSDGKVQWFARALNSSSVIPLDSFGSPEQQLNIGSWSDTQNFTRVGVRVTGFNQLELQTDMTEEALFLGYLIGKSTVFLGEDIDSSGYADVVVAGPARKRWKWRFLRDPLTAEKGRHSFYFGRVNGRDTPLVFRKRGKHRLFGLLKKRNNHFFVIGRSARSRIKRRIRIKDKAFTGQQLFSYKRPDGRFGFYYTHNQILRTINPRGRSGDGIVIPEGSSVVVGNFDTSVGEEFAFYKRGNLELPDGRSIVIDDSEFKPLKSKSSVASYKEGAEVTPTATPTRTPTVTPSPSPTATSTATPSMTPSPSATATHTFTATATITPTIVPLPTNTSLPTYTPYPTQTPAPTYTPLATLTFTPTATPTVFAPSQISGIYAWWDANESSTLFKDSSCTQNITTSGDSIGCWESRVGTGIAFTQPTSGSQPSYQNSSLPGIRFVAASENWMQFNTDFGGDSLHLFIAISSGTKFGNTVLSFHRDWNSYLYVRSQTSDSEWQVNRRNANSTTPNLEVSETFNTRDQFSLIVNNGTDHYGRSNGGSAHYYDYSALSAFTVSNILLGRFRLSSNDGFFEGDIAEIILYSGQLSDTDRQAVEGYLAHKWDMQGQLPTSHPYRNTAP